MYPWSEKEKVDLGTQELSFYGHSLSVITIRNEHLRHYYFGSFTHTHTYFDHKRWRL